MRLTTPDWVHHDGGAIYSLDLHPALDKLATCGQGEIGGLGLVIVWNLLPIRDENGAGDATISRTLARIQHRAGVNCVRWSPDGKFLACASDDKVVTVYEYGGRFKSSGTIGSSAVTTVERYREVHNLYGYEMEVLAVEWSPDQRYLASSSMDNKIFIYNAKKLPERIIVLDEKVGGHSGPVKGISWDPIGKYLASQSSDKTVRIWTIDNWSCETQISKPFEESAQTTMFLRLGWSADGQFLFAPCGMNNSGPVAQIISRKGWDTSLDIVGHRKAVTCVRVCDTLVSYTFKGKAIQCSVVAVGSRDKSLSVWVFPHVARPVVVITRLFKHSIMDMSWKGLNLAVCSQDGSIRYISFSSKELGNAFSIEQMGEACEKLYKCRPRQFEGKSADCDLADSLNSSSMSFIETADELLEQRKARERELKEPLPMKATEQHKIAEDLAEKRKEQVEVRTTEGKRRIQPIFLCSTVEDAEEQPAPKQSKVDIEPPRTVAVTAKSKLPEASTDESTESSDEEMETSESDSAKEDDVASEAEKKKQPVDMAREMMRMDFKKPELREVFTTTVRVGEVNAILDVPDQRASFSENVSGILGDTIDIDNEFSSGGVKCTRLSYVHARNSAWFALVEAPVVLAAANKLWTIIGCFDRGIRVYCSVSGILRRSFHIESIPVRLGLNANKMYALTQTGRFNSWDLDKSKAILSRLQISECVAKDADLSNISILPNGTPLLSFSTGNLFTYSMDLQCWHLVDAASTINRLCGTTEPIELGSGPLARILSHRKRIGPLPNISNSVRSIAREGQLESWIIAAEASGCSSDYKQMLISYVQQLIANRSTEKIRILIQSLSGMGAVCGLKKSALLQDVEALLKGEPSCSHLLPSKKLSAF